MKSYLIIATTLLLSFAGYSQKFGYVNTEQILSKLPEYKEAQKEIDRISVNYQKQIDQMYVSLDSMFNEFRRKEILLEKEQKKRMQDKIMAKEKEIKEFQKKIFGYEGEIFLKRQELIKPIQDKVYAAVEKVAKDQRLQVVFDKAGDLVMIYTEATHDYTDFVLEELGQGDKKDTIDNPRHKD
jgi:outer membrane protein